MFDFFYYRRISWEFQVADIAERLAVLGISLAPLDAWAGGRWRCPCPMASHGMADGDAKLIRIRSGWGVDFKPISSDLITFAIWYSNIAMLMISIFFHWVNHHGPFF